MDGLLIWQRPTLAGPVVRLPLALRRFTSVFGMGTGGSTALWSPEAGRALVHRGMGGPGWPWRPWVAGECKRIDGKERQRGAAEKGVCVVETVTGTGSLATAYGVWEKDGEYYVYSPFLGLFCLRRMGVGGGNKKSGEIKPDG